MEKAWGGSEVKGKNKRNGGKERAEGSLFRDGCRVLALMVDG